MTETITADGALSVLHMPEAWPDGLSGQVHEAPPANAGVLDTAERVAPEEPGVTRAGFDTASSFALAHRGAGTMALAADAMALVVAAVGTAGLESILRSPQTVHAQTFTFATTLLRLVVSIPLLVLVLAGWRNRWHLRTSITEQLISCAPGLAAGALVLVAIWRVLGGEGVLDPPPTDAVMLMAAFGLVTVPIVRLARHGPSPVQRKRTRRVLVVGSGDVAERVMAQVGSEPGVEVVGCVDDDPRDRSRCLGMLRELTSVCERECVDHIIVAFTRSHTRDIIEALRPVQGRLAITVVPRLFDLVPSTANLHELGSGLTGISVAPASFGWGPRVAKRTLDLGGAISALCVLAPVLAVIAVSIRATSRGPVIFRQTRIGKDSVSFSILKFRTMRIDGPPRPSLATTEAAMGPFPKLKNDPRVTKTGRVLRRTSLDELPQLWNVVRGEMSLVGPRPFIVTDDACIRDWAERRYSVRPGITGLWQVSGRNDLTFEEMCRLDNLYVSCWSLGFDLRILVRTLRAMLTRTGAY